MIRSFKDLEIYQESYALAVIVNRLCKNLPISEKQDLGSQMRRCLKSPPSNIAEGWAKRRFEKEFKLHLERAVGSCNEMEVHLSLARDLEYLDKKTCDELIVRYLQLGGKIVSLRNEVPRAYATWYLLILFESDYRRNPFHPWANATWFYRRE